jgi:UDP-glucuronate 4-epimerase
MLIDFIESLEKVINVTVIKKMVPMQADDVHQTYANAQSLEHDYEYKLKIDGEQGIEEFVSWYKSFYKTLSSFV